MGSRHRRHGRHQAGAPAEARLGDIYTRDTAALNGKARHQDGAPAAQARQGDVFFYVCAHTFEAAASGVNRRDSFSEMQESVVTPIDDSAVFTAGITMTD